METHEPGKKQYADISSSKTIDDIINEIKSRSTDGDYIYRGEPKKYPKMSSTLYREYFDDTDVNIDFEGFNLRNVQREMLNVAKKHIGEPPQGLFENLVRVSELLSLTIRDVYQNSAAVTDLLLYNSIKETDDETLITELGRRGDKLASLRDDKPTTASESFPSHFFIVEQQFKETSALSQKTPKSPIVV